MSTLERLNACTNIIAAVIILGGAIAACFNVNIGSNMVTGGFGLLVGKHLESANKTAA